MTAPLASETRSGSRLGNVAKRFVNRLVAARLTSVERELRRLGHSAGFDAAEFLPFKL
jgi:hypothetical protein